MAQIKTSELSGSALDWAVARAEGYDGVALEQRTGDWYNPSGDWAQGGPIIEREGISLTQFSNHPQWTAKHPYSIFCYDGHTLLIAAMRCYVASKLGDVVEVPDELIK